MESHLAKSMRKLLRILLGRVMLKSKFRLVWRYSNKEIMFTLFYSKSEASEWFLILVEVLFSTLTNPSRNFTVQMLKCRNKNATGTSRHHVIHHILRAHPALTVVAEVRLESNSGLKLFELQIQMIHEAWVQSSAYTGLSRREEEEGTEEETSEPCREGFLTALNTTRCQCHSCKHFAPRGFSPLRISLLSFWRSRGCFVPRQRERKGRERKGKGREQPRCRLRVAEPHLRSWASL